MAKDGSIGTKLSLNRRSFLYGAGAATALGAVGSPFVLRSADAKSLTKIKLILAWLPGGAYAYAYVAKKKDFWRKRGLDVEIARGYGSLASAQTVAHGQFDFGMSNPASAILLATKGVDLRMIGLMDYDPFMAVCMRKETPVNKPKDLVGKTVGQTMSSSDAAFFPVFCEANGVDVSKVNRLNIDAKVRAQSLRSKKVDAITGLVSSMLPSLSTVGVQTKYFLYTDYGVDLYGNIGIAVTPKTLQDRPEICKAFMDGLAEGLHFTVTDSDKAADLFLDEVPELRMSSSGPEFTKLGMGVQRAGVLSTDAPKTNGIGWADFDRLKKMEDLVMKYQVKPNTPTPDIDKIFTNKFIGDVKLSEAEWTKAKQDTAAIENILRGA